MPTSTFILPAWADLAHRSLASLRKYHGATTSPLEESAGKMETASDLDVLFSKFDDGKESDTFGNPILGPIGTVPARRVVTTMRLAQAFGSVAAYDESLEHGAVTVLGGIAAVDLDTLKRTLRRGYPFADWQIVAPDVSDGRLAKGAQERFESALVEYLDKTTPILVLQVEGATLPRHFLALDPQVLEMPPMSRDVLILSMLAGSLSDQIPDPCALHRALPDDARLTGITTLELCAVLRAATPHTALARLEAMTGASIKARGPRLEDYGNDTPVLTAARRIVDDLKLFKTGQTGWDDVSRSLLLYGPPGTGKTHLARAMGNSARVPVVNASFAEWQTTGHLGNFLHAMDATFADVRRLAPCILIIDEIDAVGSRSSPDRNHSNYWLQVVNGFLGHMDVIATTPGVIVIGTCNDLGRMDPAVLRAGRFDIKLRVPMPDAGAILDILRHHLRETIADADLRGLAHQAVGCSAADIDAAIRAARSDARHTRASLTVELLQAKLGITASLADDALRWRVAVHEAGHAVASAALGLGQIQSMAITTTGGEILRLNTPYESTLADIEAELTYLLAGRAAEKLILGEISAGAGGPVESDLARATHWAIAVETTTGLGIEGPVWHADPAAVHLQTPAIRDRVRNRLTNAETRAGRLLAQHRGTLEALARDLAEHRSLRAAEINRHLAAVSPPPPSTGSNTSHARHEEGHHLPA